MLSWGFRLRVIVLSGVELLDRLVDDDHCRDCEGLVHG